MKEPFLSRIELLEGQINRIQVALEDLPRCRCGHYKGDHRHTSPEQTRIVSWCKFCDCGSYHEVIPK